MTIKEQQNQVEEYLDDKYQPDTLGPTFKYRVDEQPFDEKRGPNDVLCTLMFGGLDSDGPDVDTDEEPLATWLFALASSDRLALMAAVEVLFRRLSTTDRPVVVDAFTYSKKTYATTLTYG